MSKLNIKSAKPVYKFNIEAERTLTRIVLASMLWEDQFYIDGKSHAELIEHMITKSNPSYVATLAYEARTNFKLRHTPLLLMRALAKTGKLQAQWLTDVIQRADEMGEFLAIYNKDGKQPLSNQVKKGLANAFLKFNEYQFAKYNRDSAQYKLRDVMFMCHPKPVDKQQEALFNKIANKQLETPDTWEVALSGGADKAETFTRLMQEKKLGALAFLRNLRNMQKAAIPFKTILEYSKELNTERVLPFRFLAAANNVEGTSWKEMLNDMMLKSLEGMNKLSGHTILLVDVSGSMVGTKVSKKSDIDRLDAACALAVMCKELCEQSSVYTFSSYLKDVSSENRGIALIEDIKDSQSHSSTNLRKALLSLKQKADRIIIFTDEQHNDSYDGELPKVDYDKKYIINVAAYENGVNSSEYHTISGFSENVFSYIQEFEKLV